MTAPALEIAVRTRVADVDAAAWDACAAGRRFASHRWMLLTEEVATTFVPRYVVATRGTTLAGVAVCALDRLGNPAGYRRSALALAVARVLRRVLPTVACELPIPFLPGLVVAGGGASDDAERVVAALLRRTETLAAAAHAPSVRMAHLGADEPWLARALATAGFRAEAGLPNMRLDVAWPTVAAWEAWLPHKKRSELRRVRRRATEAGLAIDLGGPRDDADPALRRMIRAVILRYAALDPWVEDLLPRVRRRLGDDLVLLVARAGRRPVGCLALLRSQDEMLLKWPGLDHAPARATFAYRSLLAAAVEQAIAHGARRLWLGPTAYELKRDLGAVPVARQVLVRERGRVVHWLARRAGAGRPAAAAASGARP